MDAFLKRTENRERRLWEHAMCCHPSDAKICLQMRLLDIFLAVRGFRIVSVQDVIFLWVL